MIFHWIGKHLFSLAVPLAFSFVSVDRIEKSSEEKNSRPELPSNLSADWIPRYVRNVVIYIWVVYECIFSEFHPESGSMMSTEKQRPRRIQMEQCRVCGDKALFSYFGVISCRACKVFFRRYAGNQKVTFPLRCSSSWSRLPFRKIWSVISMDNAKSICRRAMFALLVDWRNASTAACKRKWFAHLYHIKSPRRRMKFLSIWSQPIRYWWGSSINHSSSSLCLWKSVL